jgi:hypothetical protein
LEAKVVKKNFAFNFFKGSFVQYSPIVNPNDLVGKAFSAGTYLDDTAAYVGVAKVENCAYQTSIPGRATVSGNLQGPGVYVECAGEKRVTENVGYLPNHASLVWVPADENNASTIPNIIKIKGDDSSFGFAIGRVNLTYWNDTGFPDYNNYGNRSFFDDFIFGNIFTPTNYTQVAKVYIDVGVNNLWYADTNQQEQPANTTFEVLTCLETSCGEMTCEVSDLLLDFEIFIEDT